MRGPASILSSVRALNRNPRAAGAGAARNKFEALRVRYLLARSKYDDAERAIGASSGYQPGWKSWIKASDKKKLERLSAAADKASVAFFNHLESISPRDWSYGVPTHWLREDLTYEDAVRPINEPLSVVPPLSYGSSTPRT